LRLEADSVLPFPRERVFRTYRDDLAKLVPFLPNVREIEIKERVDDGPVVRFFNVWVGGGEIPAAARVVLSESMLSWDDHAEWDERTWVCKWDIATHAFPGAVSCKGENRFIELGPERTRLEIRGDLVIDLKRVRAVPSFLAGSLGRTVEQFLAGHISQNLTSVSEGLRKYMEDLTQPT